LFGGFDSASAAATAAIITAAENMDWVQVVLNGQPPYRASIRVAGRLASLSHAEQ